MFWLQTWSDLLGPSDSLPQSLCTNCRFCSQSGSFLLQDSLVRFKALQEVSGPALRLFGPGQSLCLCLPEPITAAGKGASEESRQREGSTTPEPLALRGGGGALPEHIWDTMLAEEGQRILWYDNPRCLLQAFSSLSPKPTTTTQASALYHPLHNETWSREDQSQPGRRSDKAIHPGATTPRCVEGEKGCSPPKGSPAQLITLVSLE